MAGNSYIKSVEEYFLNHARKGIMLSSVDYELINKWKTRNIPLELVLSGIREAFSGNINNDYHSIRSLKSISDFVENKINLDLSAKLKTEESISPDSDPIMIYIDKINSEIKRCKDIKIRNILTNMKDKIQSIKTSIEPNFLENELLDDIFNCLKEEERNIINKDVEKLLQNHSDKFTEKAYKKSYISHRNRLLKEKFRINIFN